MSESENPYAPPKGPGSAPLDPLPRRPLEWRLAVVGLMVVILITFGGVCEWIALRFFDVNLFF